jgi:hypothetical protein
MAIVEPTVTGLLTLGVLAMGVGGGWLCLRYGVGEVRSARKLRRYSVGIVGEVVGNEPYESSEYGAMHRPVVRYESGGRSFLTYAPGKPAPMPVGAPLRVWHLPDDPAAARCEPPGAVSFTGWMAMFCGIMLLIMVAATSWDLAASLLD